ncbi:FHA domain-containing protein [Kitasatospora sp. NPDC059795]|uniref:FHA domain-containing protein n=1 Tax=Kitasatospora sp. NPDC059795 TaxID=3346949 RepID=UPI0036514F20
MTPPPGLAIPGFPAAQERPGGPGSPGAPGAPQAPYGGGYPPAGPGSTPPAGTPAGGGGYFEPRRAATPPSGTPTGQAPGPYGAPPQAAEAPGPYGAPPQAPEMPGPYGAPPQAPEAPGPYGAPPQAPAPALTSCPICRTPQTGRYCEDCGYDYNLATSARPPGGPAPLGHQPPPAPQPAGGPHGRPEQGRAQQAPPSAQHGYGFPPPSAPPAAPTGFEPSAFEPAAPAPAGFERPTPFERPQQPYEQQNPYEPQSPYERPGYQQPAPAAGYPGAPGAPSFDKRPPAAFPDGDYERPGPVYAEPTGPQPGQPGQPGQQQRPPQQGGDDFGTSFRLTPPGQHGQPQHGQHGQPQPGQHGQPGHQGHGQPSAAPQRTAWVAVVAADPDYFNDMMARSGPEAAGLSFPPYTPERRIPLTGRGQLRIGRRSQQRGTVPEIDLSVSPEDPGASHQHALLAEQPDGSWVVVDQDSTNGTTLNGGPDTLPPHTAIPLNDGDRVHIGAWTTITVHRA